MTQEEIDKDITAFKKEQLAGVKRMMIDNGGVMPIISMLVLDSSKNETGIVIAPYVGDDFSEEAKDYMATKVIPDIFEEMKDQKLKPVCFSFSSEAWMRSCEKDEIPKDWKSLPRTEIVMLTFETATRSEMECFEIKRIGKVINSNGKMIDNIDLIPIDQSKNLQSASGRFTNIFKKYG